MGMNEQLFQLQSNLEKDTTTSYACVSPVDEDFGEPHTAWDRILGLATIVLVSAGGWALLIALVRHLR